MLLSLNFSLGFTRHLTKVNLTRELHEVRIEGHLSCELGYALSLSGDDLCQVCRGLLERTMCSMELLPEIRLDESHVTPAIHPVCLDVRYLFLIKLLLGRVSLNVDLHIGFFRPLDDDGSNFLGSLDFFDLLLVFKSRLDDVGETHVIYFFKARQFLRSDGLLTCFYLDLRVCFAVY